MNVPMMFYSGGDFDFDTLPHGGQLSLNETDSDFLSRGSFFIFDETKGMGEEDDPHEVLVYFYPESINKDVQLFLIGCTLSVKNICRNFTNHPTEVMTMDKSKLAFAKDGNFTLVLSGRTDVPDAALTEHLKEIRKTLLFYNGPFDDIMSRCGGDGAAFKKAMQKAGSELLSVINSGPAANPLRTLTTVPYFFLPSHCNRHFISACQILDSIRSLAETNYGGCLFHEDNLICSQLEFETTRLIHYRIKFLRITIESSSGSNMEGERERRRLCSAKLTLALLMSAEALQDVRNIKKVRLLASSKLPQLESAISKSLAGTRETHVVTKGITVKKKSINTENEYLVFKNDIMYGEGSAKTGTNSRFMSTVRHCHNVFEKDSEIDQLILKDKEGGYFARKYFQNEVFFRCNPKDDGPIEKEARDYIQYESGNDANMGFPSSHCHLLHR